MPHAVARDGTTIAFDTIGNGPAVLLVNGALGYRGYFSDRPLAAALGKDFTAITYDRRGRGESTDTQPYAVEREIEDIEALIDAMGGSIMLYGFSSGAVLALKAAAELGEKVTRLALNGAPLDQGEQAAQDFATYTKRMAELLAANKHGEAVALFLADLMPADMIAGIRQSPDWPRMEAVAPTLAYDNAVMGDGLVPVDDAKRVSMPALVLDAEGSPEFIQVAADALAQAMPDAQRTTLKGQPHVAPPEVLAPVLATFFRG